MLNKFVSSIQQILNDLSPFCFDPGPWVLGILRKKKKRQHFFLLSVTVCAETAYSPAIHVFPSSRIIEPLIFSWYTAPEKNYENVEDTRTVYTSLLMVL